MTLVLDSPITEEQWDMIEDVDFDNTGSITFHTKHGKKVEFIKKNKGKWILDDKSGRYRCSECLSVASRDDHGAEVLSDYCGVCGAEMEKE